MQQQNSNFQQQFNNMNLNQQPQQYGYQQQNTNFYQNQQQYNPMMQNQMMSQMMNQNNFMMQQQPNNMGMYNQNQFYMQQQPFNQQIQQQNLMAQNQLQYQQQQNIYQNQQQVNPLYQQQFQQQQQMQTQQQFNQQMSQNFHPSQIVELGKILDESILAALCQPTKKEFCFQVETYLNAFMDDDSKDEEVIGNLDAFQRKIVHQICDRYCIKRFHVQKKENGLADITITKIDKSKKPEQSVNDAYETIQKQFFGSKSVTPQVQGMFHQWLSGQIISNQSLANKQQKLQNVTGVTQGLQIKNKNQQTAPQKKFEGYLDNDEHFPDLANTNPLDEQQKQQLQNQQQQMQILSVKNKKNKVINTIDDSQQDQKQEQENDKNATKTNQEGQVQQTPNIEKQQSVNDNKSETLIEEISNSSNEVIVKKKSKKNKQVISIDEFKKDIDSSEKEKQQLQQGTQNSADVSAGSGDGYSQLIKTCHSQKKPQQQKPKPKIQITETDADKGKKKIFEDQNNFPSLDGGAVEKNENNTDTVNQIQQQQSKEAQQIKNVSKQKEKPQQQQQQQQAPAKNKSANKNSNNQDDDAFPVLQ